MLWRRRLPHWVPDDSIVFLTWRLAGTMPSPAPELLINCPTPGKSFVAYDRELDRLRTGPQWLHNPEVAKIMVEALLYGESARHFYTLYAWVIMPNHVHVVLKPHRKLSKLMLWLKGATAIRANRFLSRTGASFWQREYFDHWVRSEKELSAVIRYTENNPVKASLVASPEDWPWSSAAKTKTTGGK